MDQTDSDALNKLINDLPKMDELRSIRRTLAKVLLSYKFGLDAVRTKIGILQQEFQHTHDYNPIENVKWRLKTPESIMKKIETKGYDRSLASIREHVRDIAGMRITCSFVSDIYRIADTLTRQPDVEVVEYEDYIQTPKPNGYRSLHVILKIPVFLSDHTEKIYVELQIRTIAMDFWASLEHKIYYKQNLGAEVPQTLVHGLKDAAETVSRLDNKMELIHKEMQRLKLTEPNGHGGTLVPDGRGEPTATPLDYLSLFLHHTAGEEDSG